MKLPFIIYVIAVQCMWKIENMDNGAQGKRCISKIVHMEIGVQRKWCTRTMVHMENRLVHKENSA